MQKVGIVIINFNSLNYLKITMESLMVVKTNIPFTIGVIDNGSKTEECVGCKRLVEEYQEKYPAQELLFFDVGKNLGFSGGNNIVIKYFLQQKDITHICLLNSDVIVTDYWLDYLLEKNMDVIGPVTNAAGNEQTVQIDYSVNPESNAITTVRGFAEKRHTCYKDYMVESDLVTFFATLFKREVMEAIGLLDEQFYPGSYEDDDYCIRILNANYHIAIARDCFLHHFGSGSFSKLHMNDRKNIGNINRARFEKKWNCQWKDRTWKLLESCKQDVDFLLKGERQEWPRQQLMTSLNELEKLMGDWGEAILFFTTQADNSNSPVYNYSAGQLVGMLWAKVKRKLGRIRHNLARKLSALIHWRRNKKANRTGMDRVYQMMQKAQKSGRKPICVFAPMYDKENEKDGYIQRIKAIDTTVLLNMCRIYLYDEGADCMEMRFDFIDDLHAYIVFNSHNKEQLGAILNLIQKVGMVYTHSILRFIEDKTAKELWQIFDYEDVRHFWDVHGMVPEEYELSGSELGSQLANNIEGVMAAKVDVIVVVTEAMGRYLKNKYPSMKADVIVVPIINKELLGAKKCAKNDLKEEISIVYAGGTQPWQNIELMQNIIETTRTMYRYKMFVPNPEEFWKLWGKRSKEVDMMVDSKSPEELYKEYESCDFGFVLRDDSPVNYVACPTKIIEYLKFGIIPVLKSIEIGDFVELGMQYISYTELLKGLDISEEKRQDMIKNNYELLSKLMKIYIDGLDNLKKLVEE